MHLNRVLKYINYLIAAGLVALLCVVYWFGYRVLPETSGAIAAPVEAPVAIRRDSQGVPHIEARSLEDVCFAQGYAVAQDRLFQLELARRLGAGELAEVIGPRAAESDLDMRRHRMRRLAVMHAAALSAADRAPIAAYARGVNHFIETHRDKLPIEFRLLKMDPAPWTVADSIVVGLQMYRSMTSSYQDELTRRRLMSSAADPAMIERLLPSRTGSEPLLGSNAWAIAGRLTKSGKPLLASDPHLGFSLPSVWYQVHLKAPGLDVAGVQLPGLPGVGIGHNQHIAWGMTNLGFDVQDLYLEARGTAVQQEREVVRIAGGGQAELTYLVTAHGPVVANDAGGSVLAMRWAAADPGTLNYPFLELNRAANWADFRKALARYPGPGFNFVYADREGNIGLQVAGRLPIRKKPGDLPQPPGAADEWAGMIPFEELPSYYNPPSGMVISANQNPFPADYRYPVNGGFAPHYRARQIEAMLTRGKAWEPAGMLRVQRDVYSGFSQFLAQQLAAAVKTRGATNPALTEAVDRLSKWNGQMEAISPEALLVTLAFQHLRKVVVERAAPGQAANYQSGMAPAVLEQLLRERPANWFPDFDQVLVRVLLDAVEEAKRMQGANMSKWSYGAYNALNLEQPVLSSIPYFGSWFSSKNIRLSGSSTTVKQTTPRVGPSMRFVADLASWDNSLMNIVAGQSGHAFSSHHTDQWKSYWVGESLKMQYERVDAKDTLTLTPAN
jgi:penicillin amidase